MFDVAIVGGGPAGASCAAFCASAGLQVVVLERERFPREKVCGDCLNPACWPVLDRLGLADAVRALPHGRLDQVAFISLSGRTKRVDLPRGKHAEIAVKRSLLDQLLIERARDAGAEFREMATLTSLTRSDDGWALRYAQEELTARFVVAGDGRNSTVARLLGLLAQTARERVALQAHVALPENFGNRIVLQLLPAGYSGQAPVSETELNVCLVGRAPNLPRLREWATARFGLAENQTWRTITPLTRNAISPAHAGLLLVGDATRVVEPFTGEGIYYALRSGELAAETIARVLNGANEAQEMRRYARVHAQMYRSRVWVNRLARAAVISPRLGSFLFTAAPSALLRRLTTKITKPARDMP